MQPDPKPQTPPPAPFKPIGAVVARIVERTLAHAKARSHE
jgi:hypothetical protein